MQGAADTDRMHHETLAALRRIEPGTGDCFVDAITRHAIKFGQRHTPDAAAIGECMEIGRMRGVTR